MRKLIMRIFALLLCAGGLFLSAEESAETAEVNRLPHEVGIYFKDYFPVARMHDQSFNFLGGGISYA